MSDHQLKKHPIPIAGLLAIISVPIHFFLPQDASFAVAAVLLAVIAGIYVGFAVVADRTGQIMLQLGVALAFAGFAVIALLTNPVWIAAGYVAHGLWDAAHHFQLSDLKFPRWYIPMCAAYDIAAGIGLALIWTIR